MGHFLFQKDARTTYKTVPSFSIKLSYRLHRIFNSRMFWALFLIPLCGPLLVAVLRGFGYRDTPAHSDPGLSSSPSPFFPFRLFLAVSGHLFFHINSKIPLPVRGLLGFQLELHLY